MYSSTSTGRSSSLRDLLQCTLLVASTVDLYIDLQEAYVCYRHAITLEVVVSLGSAELSPSAGMHIPAGHSGFREECPTALAGSGVCRVVPAAAVVCAPRCDGSDASRTGITVECTSSGQRRRRRGLRAVLSQVSAPGAGEASSTESAEAARCAAA